jgi:hypothetical protein
MKNYVKLEYAFISGDFIRCGLIRLLDRFGIDMTDILKSRQARHNTIKHIRSIKFQILIQI